MADFQGLDSRLIYHGKCLGLSHRNKSWAKPTQFPLDPSCGYIRYTYFTDGSGTINWDLQITWGAKGTLNIPTAHQGHQAHQLPCLIAWHQASRCLSTPPSQRFGQTSPSEGKLRPSGMCCSTRRWTSPVEQNWRARKHRKAQEIHGNTEVTGTMEILILRSIEESGPQYLWLYHVACVLCMSTLWSIPNYNQILSAVTGWAG